VNSKSEIPALYRCLELSARISRVCSRPCGLLIIRLLQIHYTIVYTIFYDVRKFDSVSALACVVVVDETHMKDFRRNKRLHATSFGAAVLVKPLSEISNIFSLIVLFYGSSKTYLTASIDVYSCIHFLYSWSSNILEKLWLKTYLYYFFF